MSNQACIPTPDVEHQRLDHPVGYPAEQEAGARQPAPQSFALPHGRRAALLRSAAAETPRTASAERRATRRALQDWRLLQIDGVPPRLSDLTPHRDPAGWADRFLLACDPEPARSVFVLCGGRVEDAFGQRLIGRALCDVAPRQRALVQACARAMHGQLPIEVEDSYRVADGRTTIYRAVFMPVRGADLGGGYLMGAYGSLTVVG